LSALIHWLKKELIEVLPAVLYFLLAKMLHTLQHNRFLRSLAGWITTCMDAGGTTPRMGEVEPRLEQRSRAMQEQLPGVIVTQHIKGYE
jgi:hypothetical protein